MKESVSLFMLERYRLGELYSEDEKAVKDALAMDGELRSRLEALDRSDRELRLRYPAAYFKFKPAISKFPSQESFKPTRPRLIRGIAAAAILCILFPVVYFFHNARANSIATSVAMGNALADRAKGSALTGAELSLYLKGEDELPLSNLVELGEGNTVQLAYTAPAGEYYGVIFSIDGRSLVTMHYPYSRGQSSLLVSGKRTFLEEAYTLDDAPDYEVFVFVVSTEPLDADAVQKEAQKIAAASQGYQQVLDEVLRSMEYEPSTGPQGVASGMRVSRLLETLTVLKK